MSGQLLPAFAAVFGGVLVALALFVPFVAVQFRRRGELGVGPVVLSSAVLVYALALVSYTVLPLPEVTAGFCTGGGSGTQLRPGQFLTDIAREDRGGPSGLPRNPAVQQVVFNAALFVPLGMFVRYLGRRGVVVTATVGLAVSLLVEVTQLTGVWSAFPCSYRLFDVDDLIVNTAGALLGALAAPVLRLVPGQRLPDPDRPRPVTAGRRLLGMLCDGAFGIGTGQVLTVVYTVLVAATGTAVRPGGDALVRAALTSLVPALVLLAWVVKTRRTVGETVVRLRPRGSVPLPAAALRWLLGIGGYLLLSASTDALAGSVAAVLAVTSGIAVLATRGHRGLAYRVVGWDLQDDREPETRGEPPRELA